MAITDTMIMIITRYGMPPILPLPKLLNTEDIPETGRPSATISAIPLEMVMVPKVTIKGATFAFATISPFSRPNSNPVKIPARTAKAGGNNASPLASTFAIIANATPDTASMEPTDKSIPPVNITKVTPIANMALIEVCVKIVIKFVNVKNLSEMTESTAIKIISANTIAYSEK